MDMIQCTEMSQKLLKSCWTWREKTAVYTKVVTNPFSVISRKQLAIIRNRILSDDTLVSKIYNKYLLNLLWSQSGTSFDFNAAQLKGYTNTQKNSYKVWPTRDKAFSECL